MPPRAGCCAPGILAPPSALLCVVLLLAASCCDAVALGAPLLSAAAAMLWARRAHAQWAVQCPDHHFVAKDGTFVDTGTATPWTATLSSGVTYSGDSLSMSSGFVSFGTTTIGSPFSMVFRFKATAWEDCIRIFDFATTSYEDNDMHILACAGGYTDFSSRYQGGYAAAGAAPTPVNVWQHVVVTSTAGGNARLYKNGALVGTSTGTGTIPTVARPNSYLGRNNWAANGLPYFNGFISEMQVYSVVLTGAEITALNDGSCSAGSYHDGCLCSTCPAGSTSTAGSVGISQCTVLPNYYITGSGTALNTPVVCPAGYTCAGGGAVGAAGGSTVCAAGTFSTGSATSCSTCSNAALGSYYSSYGTSSTCPTASCTSAVAGTSLYTASGATAGTSATCAVATCAAPSGSQYVTSACTVTADTGRATAVTTCSAGKYMSTAYAAGSAGAVGTNGVCTNCAAGTYTGTTNTAASCTSCQAGFTSGGGAASCPTRCAHPANPAACAGLYTFGNDGSTSGCYFGSYAGGLSSGSWAGNVSTCTDCPVGTVSAGWASSSDLSGATACLNTSVSGVAACTASGPSAPITITFSGGEQRAGVAPSAKDLTAAQDEVAVSAVYSGTVGSCTASNALDGVFVCTGLTLEDGYTCTGTDVVPSGGLAASASVSAFACAANGTVQATFSGAVYAAPSTSLVAQADIVYINAQTLPTGVAAFSGGMSTSAPGSTTAGVCAVLNGTTVRCYGFAPAAGYTCAAGVGAAPAQCSAPVAGTSYATAACSTTANTALATCTVCAAGSWTTAACVPGNLTAGGGVNTSCVLCSSCLSSQTRTAACVLGSTTAAGADTTCVASFSPPPPSPPPPSRVAIKTANPAFSVSAAIGLGGYSSATFNDVAQAAFANGLASALGIATDDVTVTSASNYVFGGGASGRRLLAASVNVAFAVDTDTSTNADALASSIGAVESSPTALTSALQGAGLAVNASSVELTQRPSVAAKAGMPPGAALPTVGAISVSPSATLVNPAAQITLTAVVSSSAPALSVVMSWTVVPAAALNLSDLTRIGTPLTSNALGLLPGALLPGVAYTFKLSVRDAFGSASSSVVVTTMSVPTGGVALSSSANGTELQTQFALNTSNWTDAYLPLQYAFSYTSLNASATSTLLADFSNSTSLAGVLLPVGTIVLQVWARNALGGVSLAPAAVTVVVSRQVFVSAAAQASFISVLISNSTASGQYTYASAVSTVALVNSIADMLNDPASELSSNATAAAETRANLLAVVSAASAMAETPEALASAADAIGALVSNASQVNAAGADSALGTLQFISGGGLGGSVVVTPAASAGVAVALSSIASAALSPDSPVSPAVLEVISGVVSLLATSLLSALYTPGSAPVTVSSPQIQLSVALDLGGPDSRLFSSPLSAPGSKSFFAPMPADTFAGAVGLADSGVRTQFSSLAFDSHTQDVNSTGTTTLIFTTAAWGELNISGLSTPIQFTLPVVPLADGLKAQCQFWDTTALQYSTVGCVGLPDPLPPGHNVSWKPGFTVTSDAEMVAAWSISGLLVENCGFEVLDCSLPDSPPVYPNLRWPFDVPAVKCNASISSEPILAVTGSSCALIQDDNALRCWWNNSKGAFQGPGCVASGEPVQCLCRHLTEFAGTSKPSLPMASLSDLVGLNPADIVSKLKLLFQVVIILFGIMNLGAVAGGIMDRRERKNYLERLRQPHMGYRVAKDGGAWLWSFSIEPMRDVIDAPVGPAVEICELLGIPFARLRYALPDEMLSWDMTAALGRVYGMSRSGWETSAADLKEKLPSFFGSLRRSRNSARTSQVDPALAAEADRVRQAMVMMEEFVGTAVVLAFLQVAALMPVAELAERCSAARQHFEGVRTAFGRDFSTTRTDFVTLLSPGVLNLTKKWLPRARLWRLILSQTTAGYWDASSTTALVLQSRTAAEVDELPTTLLKRISDALKSMSEALAGAEEAGDGADGIGGRHEHEDGDGLFGFQEDGVEEEDETPRARRPSKPVNDCPLTCSVDAIAASIPRALSKLATDASTAKTLRRVWCTMCCISVLERLIVCFVWGDGDLYAPEERTIVDAGREWIEAQAAEWPQLAAALEGDKVMKLARRTTKHWNRAWEQRVSELRASPALRHQMGRSHVHRTAIGITRGLVAQNETFRTFLSEPLDGLQRWQMWMILVSLIISQLLVNIWMYYAKAVNCCAEVVSLLDGGPDGGNCASPAYCRGFVGNCADIAAQFAEVPILPYFPNGLADYTCHAFPDEDRPLDSFLVGLISIAIALPASLFLASCFSIANDSEAPESWMEWYGWRKLVFGVDAHRKWHYTGPLGQPTRHVKWFIRSVGAPPPETVINLWHSLVAWVTGTDTPWVEEWREATEAEAEEEEAEAEIELAVDAAACDSGSASLHQVNGGAHPTSRDAFRLSLAEHADFETHGLDKGKPSYVAADHDGASTTSSVRSARALARYKRLVALTGFIGVYVSWTIFTWFIFVYGMLIYRLLGDQAQQEFARSWGVSYGMNVAVEWKDVLVESLKGAVILAILERLYVTRAASWFEDHIDYYCVQSQLFNHATMNVMQQSRLLWRHTKRISD